MDSFTMWYLFDNGWREENFMFWHKTTPAQEAAIVVLADGSWVVRQLKKIDFEARVGKYKSLNLNINWTYSWT